MNHYYIERSTGIPVKETFFSDKLINFIYNPIYENFNFVFKILTGKYSSKAAAYFNYESLLKSKLSDTKRLMRDLKIKEDELYLTQNKRLTPKLIFERKIYYWDKRPLNKDLSSIASPCDSRVITGDDSNKALYFIKEKFFSYDDLIPSKKEWSKTFKSGCFAIFRLTPDKYHYNHTPVSGKVVDFYEIDGVYHSCNPSVVSKIDKPFCKNKRVVTILDTDVENGSNIGKVCMVEVAALMIGEIIQCYSQKRYEHPKPIKKGMFIEKGQPKSRFAPGSSTVIILFEKGKIRFDDDLIENRNRNIESRFSKDFTTPLIETDINVREQIAYKI